MDKKNKINVKMLKNENIICISSIDWDFIWQGHQEIMSTFARNGNRVLFVENTGIRLPTFRDMSRLRKRIINWFKSVRGFREETENLFIYSPIILPFPYSKIVSLINRHILLRPMRRWMRIMKFHNPIIWTFLPTGTTLDIANSIDKKLLVYYCIADFYELADNPKKVMKTETKLLKTCDLVFAQGRVFEEKCKKYNENVAIFPFGVRTETFENFKISNDGCPNDLKDIKKPIVGYIGGVHRHIDFSLVRYIVESHADWSVVFVGPIQTDISKINKLSNIYFLGKKDFSSLPNYIDKFDVCMIPYRITEYTKTVYPTKMNEFHIMGKPVVSTRLPEVEIFNAENNNLIFIGNTNEEFTKCISKALNNKGHELVGERIESAKRNNWTKRIEEMSDLIEDAIEKKSRDSIDWQKNLTKYYRTSRRKAFKIGIIVLSIYLLIFYTPLVWYMAEPLRFSQPPEKADCIVVFAGGVGESGKAGQGYEERVEYAIRLYKQGYAEHLIFSSGYMYVFHEPLLMKSLAVSLGAPEDAIILEDEASNTYENVKFTKKILADKNWDKILLVSSPYHMRRVSLVANKIIHETKIIYTPLPESRFYSHGAGTNVKKVRKQINLKQIKGLMHEYLGIVYYWWKGYI